MPELRNDCGVRAFYDENIGVFDRRGCSRDDQTSLVMLWQIQSPWVATH